MIFFFWETFITAYAMLCEKGLIHAASAITHSVKKEQCKYSQYPRTGIERILLCFHCSLIPSFFLKKTKQNKTNQQKSSITFFFFFFLKMSGLGQLPLKNKPTEAWLDAKVMLDQE